MEYKPPGRKRYRVDHFLLDREAAARRSASVASYAAYRKGYQSLRVPTQNAAVIIIELLTEHVFNTVGFIREIC
jgi:hypothetical protein